MFKEEKFSNEFEVLNSIPSLYSFTKKCINTNINIKIPPMFINKYMDVDITEEIEAFASILEKKSIIDFKGDKNIIFYELDNISEIENIYEYLKVLVKRRKKFDNNFKGILYLEIRELAECDDDKKLNDLLAFMDDFKENIYFILSYTQKNNFDKSEIIFNKINSQMYIYKISLDLPSKKYLCEFLEQYLQQNNFILDESGIKYIDYIINSYFMNDISSKIYKYPLFVNELTYYLLFNDVETNLSKFTLVKAIKNNNTLKTISNMNNISKKQARIGFSI